MNNIRNKKSANCHYWLVHYSGTAETNGHKKQVLLTQHISVRIKYQSCVWPGRDNPQRRSTDHHLLPSTWCPCRRGCLPEAHVGEHEFWAARSTSHQYRPHGPPACVSRWSTASWEGSHAWQTPEQRLESRSPRETTWRPSAIARRRTVQWESLDSRQHRSVVGWLTFRQTVPAHQSHCIRFSSGYKPQQRWNCVSGSWVTRLAILARLSWVGTRVTGSLLDLVLSLTRTFIVVLFQQSNIIWASLGLGGVRSLGLGGR